MKAGKAEYLFDRIVDYLAGAGAILVGATMLMVSIEVVMRFLHHPQIWVIEICEYSLVWVTFLGATWILRSERHVQVDILLGFLSPRARALLGIVSSLIGVCVSLVLCVMGAKVVLGMIATWEVDPRSQIGIPEGPLLAIIPACSLPLLIQFVRRGLGCFHDWKNNQQRGRD